MRRFSIAASAVTLALGLAPVAAFAATATTDAVTEDEVLNVLSTPDAMSVDGRGGGGSVYYPGPYGGGITVDASVTKEVTPDFVAVNGYCEVTGLDSRDDVRTELTKMYNAIKTAVGSDGRVRRNGGPSVYPYYDPYGATSSKMSGSLSVFIRVTKVSAAQRISDILEENNCNPNWDVRLLSAEDYEIDILDSLLARLNKRKTVFEKLLGKKLTNVTGASLSTWIDGYNSYDPETNKADATTTLSITFELGARTRISPSVKEVPKG